MPPWNWEKKDEAQSSPIQLECTCLVLQITIGFHHLQLAWTLLGNLLCPPISHDDPHPASPHTLPQIWRKISERVVQPDLVYSSFLSIFTFSLIFTLFSPHYTINAYRDIYEGFSVSFRMGDFCRKLRNTVVWNVSRRACLSGPLYVGVCTHAQQAPEVGNCLPSPCFLIIFLNQSPLAFLLINWVICQISFLDIYGHYFSCSWCYAVVKSLFWLHLFHLPRFPGEAVGVRIGGPAAAAAAAVPTASEAAPKVIALLSGIYNFLSKH